MNRSAKEPQSARVASIRSSVFVKAVLIGAWACCFCLFAPLAGHVMASDEGMLSFTDLVVNPNATSDAAADGLTEGPDEAQSLCDTLRKVSAAGIEVVNATGITLCSIPAGDFQQGYVNWMQAYIEYERNRRTIFSTSTGELMNKVREGPTRWVTIPDGFWIGKFEVTQRQFLEIMGRNPSWFTRGDSQDRPVDSVTVADAMEFCARLTEREREAGSLPEGWVYRLPSESEWEYAARAGRRGNLYGDVHAIARIRGSRPSVVGTEVVGSREPNAWGLHDMLGNVWEWCLDHFDGGYPDDPPENGTAWQNSNRRSSHVIRGGAFDSHARDVRLSSRSRNGGRPGTGARNVGFRVVLSRDDGFDR